MRSIRELYFQEGYKTTQCYYDNNTHITTDNLDGLSIRLIERNTKKLISTKLNNIGNEEKFIKYLEEQKRSIHLIDTIRDCSQKQIVSKNDIILFNEIINVCAKYKKYLKITMENLNLSKVVTILDKKNEKNDNFTTLHISDNENKYSSVYFSLVSEKNIEKVKDEIKEILPYIGIQKIEPIKSGEYDLVFKSPLGGILFHEVFGHQFELSKSKTPISPVNFPNNYKIARKNLTIKDVAFNNILTEKFDDEGNVKLETILIKNGMINSPLTDLKTLMEYPQYYITGNARRESHIYYPEPRMYCTIVENGKTRIENMLNNIEHGFYIESISEAYLDHLSGIVRCYINKAFIIKNGKINNEPIKFIIEDNAMKIIDNIEYISNDFSINSGCCNSNSGRLYIEYGAPSIQISKINIKEGYVYGN